MDRESRISALQADLLSMVADHLTPVALRYGYSDVPLETNIKWRPQVLVIGNYSSGKSTLINEFLGAKIQATGQAPTDDSFTIITYDDSIPKNNPVHITEERDGNYLLNDPEYPFEILKKYGEKFTSHFLEVLFTYRKKRRAFCTRYTLTGFIISVLCGGAAVSLTFAKSVIKVRRKFAKP